MTVQSHYRRRSVLHSWSTSQHTTTDTQTKGKRMIAAFVEPHSIALQRRLKICLVETAGPLRSLGEYASVLRQLIETGLSDRTGFSIHRCSLASEATTEWLPAKAQDAGPSCARYLSPVRGKLATTPRIRHFHCGDGTRAISQRPLTPNRRPWSPVPNFFGDFFFFFFISHFFPPKLQVRGVAFCGVKAGPRVAGNSSSTKLFPAYVTRVVLMSTGIDRAGSRDHG